MKTLILTNETSAVRVVRALKSTTQIIVGVVAAKSGEDHPLESPLEKLNIDIWHITDIKDGSVATKMQEAQIDLLLTFRFPRIVPPPVIAAASLAAFNLHTGPLPAYAGLNVPSWAIFNGETAHGVTVHRLAEGIDTGEIITSESFPIAQSETGVSLTGKCVSAGSRLMAELTKALAAGNSITGTAQPLEGRQYYSKDIPGMGRIDWSWDAIKLDRLVRASNFYPFKSPWGTPIATLGEQAFGVLRTEVISELGGEPGSVLNATENMIDVATGEGTLRIVEVTDGHNVCSISDLVQSLNLA